MEGVYAFGGRCSTIRLINILVLILTIRNHRRRAALKAGYVLSAFTRVLIRLEILW